MPIYEYQCSSCHHHFDVLQKINDEPVKICPECSKESVVRLVSAAGFQLKGSGWYATDFKNKGKPENQTQTKDAAPAHTKSAEKKSTDATTTSSSSTKGESN